MSTTPTSPAKLSHHEAVAAHLGIHARTLKEWMDRTPEGVAIPWINVGLGKRPTYRWQGGFEAAEVWFRAVCEAANPQSPAA